MATYGGGIKISSAIATSKNSTGAIFTLSSGQYAIVNVGVSISSGSVTITVGGEQVISLSGSLTTPVNVYVGPSQSLSISALSGTVTVFASGVVLTN